MARSTCVRCGTQGEEGVDLPPGWSLVTDERGVGLVCEPCTRSNIRSIEAKLPEEYWE